LAVTESNNQRCFVSLDMTGEGVERAGRQIAFPSAESAADSAAMAQEVAWELVESA
jgi:hypothetical protein